MTMLTLPHPTQSLHVARRGLRLSCMGTRHLPKLFTVLACAVLTAAAWAAPGLAQEDAAGQEVRRLMSLSSLERDQQSDAFALRLQQHQREINATPADRARIERDHSAQRRQLDQLAAEQRRSAGVADAPSWGPQLDLRPQMERERRQLLDRIQP